MSLYKERLWFEQNGQIVTSAVAGIAFPGLIKPDLAYTGMVGTVKLGETVVVGDLLYFVEASQDFMLADPTSGAVKGPVVCMALQGGDLDDYVLAIFSGYVRYDAWLRTEYLAAKARGTYTQTDVTVDAEITTIGEDVLGNDISDDGIVAGSTFVVVPAGTSMAQFQAVATGAIWVSLLTLGAASLLTEVELNTDWSGNAIIFRAARAGIAGNLIATLGSGGNATWGAATMTGGTDGGHVYLGDAGKPACLARKPDTGNDAQAVIGIAISPNELLFNPDKHMPLKA